MLDTVFMVSDPRFAQRCFLASARWGMRDCDASSPIVLVPAINSLAVAEGKYDDEKDVILDGVDDAVVTHPHPVSVTVSEFLCAWGAGVGGKKGDCAPKTVRMRFRNGTQSFDRCRPKLDAIGHCQPRSALTCSQGMLSPSSASAWSKACSSSCSSSASSNCS